MDKQLKIDNTNPELKDAYMKKTREYGVSEQTLMDYWDDGEAEGEQKGYLKGLEEGKADGLEEGKAEGLEEGMRKGKAEGKAEGLITGARRQLEATVRSMNQYGMSTERIAEIVGITALEVEAILNNPKAGSD